MMKISTKGRYALRVMVDLACADADKPVALRSVAERQHMTIKYLESIIALLVRERLVVSTRGKSGGYRLSRPAADYNVYEILCAAEGDLEPVQCLSDRSMQCPLEDNCATVSVWRGLSRVVREYLEGISLADISGSRRGEFSFCDGI